MLGLPRGGVPVAFEIATRLSLPLGVWVTRRLSAPWRPELGLGAVAEGNYVYINQDVVERAGVSGPALEQLIEAKSREITARQRLFRGGDAAPVLRNRNVIVVDDGIATGGTLRAALRSIRVEEPKRVVLAVGVAHPQVIASFEHEAHEIVCLLQPHGLVDISPWYRDFMEVSDVEVMRLLARGRARERGECTPPPA